MSPFRRNWEQYSFNKVEQDHINTQDEWEDEMLVDEGDDDLSLLLDDAQDAVSRFMSKESRRGENRVKKPRQAWQ